MRRLLLRNSFDVSSALIGIMIAAAQLRHNNKRYILKRLALCRGDRRVAPSKIGIPKQASFLRHCK